MPRLHSISRVLACSMLALACGRTPLASRPELIVQVIDEAGNGVHQADIELRGRSDAERDVTMRARTDSAGVAELEYPGAGSYEVHASTGLICCFHDGSAVARIDRAGELVIVETTTGPCPTAVPRWCDY